MYVDPDDVIETHPKIVALRAQLAQVTQERDILKVKHADLMKWYDTMFGTPCEEIRHQQQIEKLEEELAQAQQREGRLVKALEASDIALVDWLNIYACDYCDAERVKEAKERIRNENGTLAYIASIHKANKAALTPSPVSTPPTRSDIRDSECQMEEGRKG